MTADMSLMTVDCWALKIVDMNLNNPAWVLKNVDLAFVGMTVCVSLNSDLIYLNVDMNSY